MGVGKTNDLFCYTAAPAIVFNYTPAGLGRKMSADSCQELPHHKNLIILWVLSNVLCTKKIRQVLFLIIVIDYVFLCLEPSFPCSYVTPFESLSTVCIKRLFIVCFVLFLERRGGLDHS